MAKSYGQSQSGKDIVTFDSLQPHLDGLEAAWDAKHKDIVLSVQSLQSQIDSVGSRNNFDEITATSLFSEIVAASKGAFGSIEVLGGIPKSALEASVQTSLGKADTALQSHQAIYSLIIQKNGTSVGSYTPNFSSATINIDDVASAAIVQEMKKITDLFEISGNDVTLKKNGTNARNFIAFGSISSGGAGQGGQGGSGSVTAIELNGVRYSPAEGTTIINLPAYPTKESLYLSNVENKSSATIRSEITSENITTALGYTPYNASDISSARVAYATTAGSAPASDVYAWAKATNKPSYEYSEITNKPSTLAGYGITDNVAYQGAANDFVHNGNEITMIPSEYNGSLWFNYRTKGGLNGGITDYIFGNGAGGSIVSLSTLMSNDDMLTVGVQSLQSQIDSVGSRNNFDELRATVVSSDVVVAQTAYIASIIGNISGNADTASYLVSSSHGVGSAANPVYFSGGRPYACSYSFGNSSGNAALNNGALNANLYAERAKDYDADGGISSDFTTVAAALKSLQSQINSVGSRDYSELWEMLIGLKLWIESMFELTSDGIHAKYSLYSSGSITAAA